MLKMDSRNDLSADEISKAASLAEELRRQDAERQSVAAAAEEVGIPQEYLAIAATQIQAETAERRTVALRRRNIAIIAACVLTSIVAVNVLLWRMHQVEERREELDLSAASVVAPKTVAKETPEIADEIPTVAPVPLSILPVPARAPILVRDQKVSVRVPVTQLTFSNRYEQPVNVYEMNSGGSGTFKFSLSPGETRKQTTKFGQPWLITDTQGNNLGLFFPQTTPAQVSIPSARALRSLGAASHSDHGYTLQGYLSPVPYKEGSIRTASSARVRSAIEFVNFSGESVDLYRIDAEGVRVLVTTLAPGANFISPTYTADNWLAVNSLHDVIASFKADPVPRTAILW